MQVQPSVNMGYSFQREGQRSKISAAILEELSALQKTKHNKPTQLKACIDEWNIKQTSYNAHVALFLIVILSLANALSS